MSGENVESSIPTAIVTVTKTLARVPTRERDANQTLIEGILRGDEPDGLSLEKLRKNLPVCWNEQRERW